MVEVETILSRFFQNVVDGNTEIYNECSLQHELGIFLRTSTTPGQYKVQFERPVTFFQLSRSEFVKKEIDLVVFTPDSAERVAIEGKFPRNGQYPEQMFKFCEDVLFCEQLVLAGFTAAFFVVAADDRLFYSGENRTGIYAPFRGNQPLHGTIVKPTGKRDETFQIRGSYRIDWRQAGNLRYASVAANPAARQVA